MKVLGVISTTALFLLFGATVPAFAQEQHQEQEAKPQKQEQQAKPEKQQQAKPEKQQEQAKAAKQEQAKPEKREAQAKPEKQQEQAKPAKQEQQKETKGQQGEQQKQQQQAKSAKQEHVQQVKGQQGQQHEQAQGQWAHNGQKDSRGHEYNESRFGREHHARFEEHGGRYFNGRREYSYGGYWFYAGAYPAWFYQQDVYFIMGADGLWYAVAYGDPSLTFQINIE
jgi:hypothetical protein